jgi:hypothetical protein
MAKVAYPADPQPPDRSFLPIFLRFLGEKLRLRIRQLHLVGPSWAVILIVLLLAVASCWR